MARFLAAAAAAVLLVVATSYSQEVAPNKGDSRQLEQHGTSATEQKTDDSQTKPASPPIIVNVHGSPKSPEERDEEARERQEKAALDKRLVDLTDQLARYTGDLATYTKDLAAYTLGLLIATILTAGAAATSLVFAAFQLRDSKRAGIAAKTSADAASKSADVGERALVAGQRAFVAVIFDHSATKNINTGKIVGWNFQPVWLNNGSTPTRSMNNHVSIFWPPNEIEQTWDFPDYWDAKIAEANRIPHPLSVAPNGRVFGQKVFVPVEIMKEVIDGKRFLYLWGWATYHDIFPNTDMHVTRFAVKIIVGGDPLRSDRISFEYNYLSRYNCSDEECSYQGYPAKWKTRQEVAKAPTPT